MSDSLRDKAKAVEDDLRSLREDRATAVKAREDAKEAYAAVPDDQDDSAAFNVAKEATRTVGELDEQINALSSKHIDILKMQGDKEAIARGDEKHSLDKPWGASSLLADPQLQEQLKFISGTKSRFGSVEIGEIMGRDELAQMFAVNETGGVTNSMREGTRRGPFPQLVRPLNLLDVIPTGTADGNLIPYTQEVGQLTGGGTVAEGDPKPQADIAFIDADAPVRTIAAYMKLRKQILSDFPALRSIMDTRLRYLVQRRLEEQILSGDGNGSNLTGLLNVSGTGSVAYNANVPLNEIVLSGITNVALNLGVADAVVVHPVDWMHIVTEKASNAGDTAGSFDYYGGGPYAGTPASLWGVPVISSQAMPAGVGIVADFALSVTLLIREGVNVLLSDSDQDDFIRNRVTMLAEMRAALPVWRPSTIQELDLAA